MKTTILLKSRKLDAESSTEALPQLRSIKQTAAFLLLLFGTLIFALVMSSCGDDKNEEDIDRDIDFTEENTTLSVAGEVNGTFKAIGQVIEHFDEETQLHVNSFIFLESDDEEISQFHITISR